MAKLLVLFRKLKGVLSTVPDNRMEGKVKHPLYIILIIVFVATMAGCNGWVEIHDYAVARFSIFKAFIPELTSIPGVDTIARAIAKLNQERFQEVFIKLAAEQIKLHRHWGPGRPVETILGMINVDGKSNTGSLARGAERTDVHIVNAVWLNLVLAARRVTAKSNEITAIPHLLKTLHRHRLLKRMLVTTDAMGCQKAIADEIIKYSAHWLFGLKGNHSKLHDQVVSLFNEWMLKYPDDFEVATHETPYELVGGRRERRRIAVVRLEGREARGYVTAAAEWPGIRTVIKVERFVDKRESKGKKVDATHDVRYYISSHYADPETLLRAIRGHWGVETVHYKLDVAFGEDKCKVNRGAAAEVLSGARKLALNRLVGIQRLFNMSLPRLINLCNSNPMFAFAAYLLPPEDVGDPLEWMKAAGNVDPKAFIPVASAA
jgi:predicted transposase YbfD/YdcC